MGNASKHSCNDNIRPFECGGETSFEFFSLITDCSFLCGLSLKMEKLTALFLGVRLYCSVVIEYDIHTLPDSATLRTTSWVIYMMRFKLKSTYMDDKDNFVLYYVAVPSAVLAFVVHPSTSHYIVNRVFWAFCVYPKAVSVLPQLCTMQNTKIVEPFTAHYVFALGVARFLSCAHWILQIVETRGLLLTALLWVVAFPGSIFRSCANLHPCRVLWQPLEKAPPTPDKFFALIDLHNQLKIEENSENNPNVWDFTNKRKLIDGKSATNSSNSLQSSGKLLVDELIKW